MRRVSSFRHRDEGSTCRAVMTELPETQHRAAVIKLHFIVAASSCQRSQHHRSFHRVSSGFSSRRLSSLSRVSRSQRSQFTGTLKKTGISLCECVAIQTFAKVEMQENGGGPCELLRKKAAEPELEPGMHSHSKITRSFIDGSDSSTTESRTNCSRVL